MPDTSVPDDEAADPPHAPTPACILVPRPALEQMYAHLVSAYDSYQTRRLRQAIMILEHILKIRP